MVPEICWWWCCCPPKSWLEGATNREVAGFEWEISEAVAIDGSWLLLFPRAVNEDDEQPDEEEQPEQHQLFKF